MKNLLFAAWKNSSRPKIGQFEYFNKLNSKEQTKLKYLIPLKDWFAMVIYPSLDVKKKAQNDDIRQEIKKIVDASKEKGNWPIEVDLDACRNF